MAEDGGWRPGGATLLASLLLPLLLLPGWGQVRAEPVSVRTGDHPGYGRVVVEWPARVDLRTEIHEGRVVLRARRDEAPELRRAGRLPRNVTGVAALPDGVEIAVRPGARPRVSRIGARVVVDVRDPPAPEAAATAPVPAEPTAPARRAARPGPLPLPAPAAEPPARVAEAPRTATAPAPAPAPAPPQAVPAVTPSGAIAVAVRVLPGQPPSLAVPVEPGTGAALLRRGEVMLLVLDGARTLDLARLRSHPALAGAEAQVTPEATVLRLPLASPLAGAPTLRARRERDAWVLEAPPADPAPSHAAPRPLVPEAEAGGAPHLVLRAAGPGRAVALTDPATAGPLLVGTVREEGQALAPERRLPQFDLLPTLLGVAVLARADAVVLRAGADRFTLAAAGGGRLSLGVPSPPRLAEAAGMGRAFDLPALPVPALQDRLRAQQATVAAAAPLARGLPRRDAAETLLALGLPHEAQAMLTLALTEDPAVARDPRALGLLGASALLAGRLAEAGGLDDPRLPAADETVLWRGLLAAARGDAAAAAPGLAATLPLLLSYPEPLRARLVAPVAEALLEGGETAAAGRLVATAPDEAAPLARARLLEAAGETGPALAAYDALASGRDRRLRVRALRRAVDLRLATGALTPAAAAAAFEPVLLAWRGDADELAGRVRLAELRRGAGDHRGALDLLRETAQLFPERAAGLRPLRAAVLVEAITAEPPLLAVALHDADAALMPDGPAGEAALAMLAERLLALDLGSRADALLRQGLERSADPATRAGLGTRLARLRLAERDATGALAALDRSAAPDLPAGMVTERAVLRARALAATGAAETALAELRALGPAGAEALSDLLSGQRDWAGAAAALSGALAAGLPPAPAPLPLPTRRALARLAAFLVLAGDEPALAALRAEHGQRMAEGPLSEAFGVLTAPALRGLADLPRLAGELEMVRAMPDRLEALRAAAPPAR